MFWLVKYMVLNPDVQEQCFKEISDLIGSAGILWDYLYNQESTIGMAIEILFSIINESTETMFILIFSRIICFTGHTSDH